MKLKKPIAMVALVAVYGAGAVAVDAQQSTPQPRSGSAERALVGIALFDTGAKVVSRFGSPDDIQALTIGGGAAGGGAPGGGPGGGPAGGGPAGRGGGGGGGASPAVADWMIGDPFNDPYFQAAPQGVPTAGGPPGGGRPPGGGQGGFPGRGGDDERGVGGPPGRGGGGAVGGGGQNAQDVVYTRWVYNRNGSRYGFVFDRFNRVVQIEAVGLTNRSVKTRRGITFGSTFAQVIKAYNAPDGYEVNGNNIVVRFLVRDRVAFRMSKLKENSPHVVTGVVVAAGKS